MKFEFTISLRDYKHALKLHRKRTLSRRLFPLVCPALLALSIIAFVGASLARNLVVASQAVALAAGSLTGIIALPILRFFSTRRCYKLMFPSTRTSPTSTIDIDDQRIVEENPGTEEVKLAWSGALDFVQDERVTLIYINPSRFFLFPTSAMSSDQRAELDSLVARHVVKK
jgi:hypothetical protein